MNMCFTNKKGENDMEFINPPAESIQNVTHKTFFCKLYNHEIGYNIYLPPDYEYNNDVYPISYHIHGWMGSESSELKAMEKIFRSKRVITVFPNSSPVIGDFENLPVEKMFINEFIPYIESKYRTDKTRINRSISGFSMGGGMAFCYAVRYNELFSSVTAYAGTYHHYYHKNSKTVGAEPEKAAELYKEMMKQERYLEEGNILFLIKQNADKIRGELEINLYIGTNDVLYCDNEILHLYLDFLCIPHKYKKIYGIGHELDRIVLDESEHKKNFMPLKHKGTTTLETERLILRRFKTDDIEQIYYNCWNDPDVWKWTNYEPMNSIDDVYILNNIFTDHWFARYEKLDFYSWAIQLKSSGKVIGRLSGIKPDEKISQIELAYELGRNWWNQGFMTEAVKAVTGFFFREVGFNRICADHAYENPASGKVMQKCGLVYEGTFRQKCKCNNGIFNMVSYAILASDYFNTEDIKISIIPYERKYQDDMLFCFLAAKDAVNKYAPEQRWNKPVLKEDLFNIEKDYFENDDIFYLAIDYQDRVVGMVGTKTTTQTELWLKRLFVKPEMKNKGIGSKLLSAVEKYAVNKGIIEIHTEFANWYREAAVFYLAKGFEEAERNEHLIHMKKQLKNVL